MKEHELSKAPSVHTTEDEDEDEEDEDEMDEDEEKDMEGETLKVCIVFYRFQLICKHTSFCAGRICSLRSVCSTFLVTS